MVSLQFDDYFSVITAESGIEGIAVARAERPQAILLDWMMPDMDGAATLIALRDDANTRDIPVVFLTGKAHGEDPATFVALGAVGAIPKPFNPMTLAREVADLLARAGPSR